MKSKEHRPDKRISPFIDIDSNKQQVLFHPSTTEIDKLTTLVGYWLPEVGRVAVFGVDGKSHLTYRALQAQIMQAPFFAGQRVAILISRQEPDLFATVMLTVMHQSGTVCLLEPTMKDTELRAAITQLKCRAAIVPQSLKFKLRNQDMLRQICPVIVGDKTVGEIDWLPVEQHLALEPDEVVGSTFTPDRPFLMLRTSGTTSKPKVVPLVLHIKRMKLQLVKEA